MWYLRQSIGFSFNKYIQYSGKQEEALIACVVTALITLRYFYVREGFSDVKRLWESKRFDLLVLVALGLFMSVSLGGVGTSLYQEYVGKIDVLQLIVVVSAPLVIALMLMLKKAETLQKMKERRSATPFFLNDEDIKTKNGDRLKLSDRAAGFAEAV